MFSPFALPFFQRGLVEILLLAIASGLLGTWIVLRGLAFLAHAVGTATFPGLVLADGLGFSAALGAFGAALLVAGLVGVLATRPRSGADSATALVLAGALALGVVLASDVFGSQASVERLLFGSLLLIDGADLRLAGAAALLTAIASAWLGSRWLAAGFTGAAPRARGADLALVLLIAFVAVAALAAVGALLATALLVVPAATTRLVTNRLRTWQAATVGLAAVEGVVGMWLAFQLNAPPGAALAVLSGTVFAAVALANALRARSGPAGRAAVAAGAVLAVLALGGCASSGRAADGRPQVVTTTTQLADLARQVGGPAFHVRSILRPNTDPHEYEPRPKDVQAVADAAVVLTSGLGLDGWARQVVSDAGTHARVVDVGQAASRAVPGDRSGDPHWWHDPRAAIAATTVIERALAAADPAGAAALVRRATAYRARIERLDAAIRACVARVPPAQRRIVTDHDAFGRFARRYGITVVGAVIPSATTRAQASAGDLAALERTIRRERVRAVFPEQSVNAKLAERIAADTGAQVGGRLYGDTLGPAGSPGSTYLGMEAANARTLVRGMSAGAVTCPIRP